MKKEVVIKNKGTKKVPTSPVKPYYKSQQENLDYWDKKYKEAVKEIQEAVLEVIKK